MGDMSKGVAKTLYPGKKYLQEKQAGQNGCCCIFKRQQKALFSVLIFVYA
jgi:hypothetical protein